MLSRLLYFLPGLSGCSEQMLQKLGLRDRFLTEGGRLGAWVVCEQNAGPDGQRGCIVATGNRPPEFSPVRQVWVRVDAPGCKPDHYFLGLENMASKPGPDELANSYQIDGYGVRLCDGREWIVPRVLRWDADRCEHVTALPEVFVNKIVDGRRRVVREINAAYQPLDALARRIWDAYLHQTPLPLEQVIEGATALLSANYRIGLDEVSLLGLLDPLKAQDVLWMSIDRPAIEAQAEEMTARGLRHTVPPRDVDEMKEACGG